MFGGAAAPVLPPEGDSTARTQVFGGPSTEPRLDLPGFGDEGPAAPPLFARERGLELPGGSARPASQRPVRADPAERALAEALARRSRRVVGVLVGLVVLGAVAWFGRNWWANRSDMPLPARAERDSSFALLRRDDPQARATALKALDGLVTRYPGWVGARATQALALTLELDDQRAILKRGLADAEQASTQLARLEAEHSPADWRAQADGARLRLGQLKKLTDPMVDAVNTLELQLNATRDALNRLPPAKPEDEVARLRADAVYAGVAGRDKAVEYAEKYRQLGGKDGWGDVAYAEYALSARVAPESIQQALKSMNALVAHDTTFIRPYVLAGRLALQLRQKDVALARLDAAVTLNPRHKLAQTLAEQERGR